MHREINKNIELSAISGILAKDVAKKSRYEYLKECCRIRISRV